MCPAGGDNRPADLDRFDRLHDEPLGGRRFPPRVRRTPDSGYEGLRHEVELPGIEPPEERRSRPAVRWHRAWRAATRSGAAGNRTRVPRPRDRASTSVVRGQDSAPAGPRTAAADAQPGSGVPSLAPGGPGTASLLSDAGHRGRRRTPGRRPSLGMATVLTQRQLLVSREGLSRSLEILGSLPLSRSD